MPSFLPNFADIRGFASSINPLNAFNNPESPTTVASAGSVPATAVAGPGPSTQAISRDSARRSTSISSPAPDNNLPPQPLALGPALVNGNDSTSESSGSFVGVPTPRKASTNGVAIAHPEVLGGAKTRARSGTAVDRKERSAGPKNGMEETGNGPRRKRVLLDTYIIVKPPPTTSKNPLNLQIQLVIKPPKLRDRSASRPDSLHSTSTSTNTTLVHNAPTAAPAAHPVDLNSQDSQSTNSAVNVSFSSSAQLGQSSSGSPPKSVGVGDATRIKRSGSMKSNASGISSVRSSSTSSISGGSQKRVEPMFNLSVHHVMQSTVVTDAATDVKVAKFLKRSLDISGVGVLEPSEVWLPPSINGSSANMLPTHSDENHPTSRTARPMSIASYTPPLSPTLTRSDDGRPSGARFSLDVRKTSMDIQNLSIDGILRNGRGEEGNTKRFLGKLFKRKGVTELSTPPIAEVGQKSYSPAPSELSLEQPSASTMSAGGTDATAAVKPTSVATQASLTVGYPTFGTAPIIVRRRSSGAMMTQEGAVTGLTASTMLDSNRLSVSPPKAGSMVEHCTSMLMVPSNRPIGYTWTVRKWTKANADGWAAQLVAAASAGMELVSGGLSAEGDGDVVFEWVKMRGPANASGASLTRGYFPPNATVQEDRASSRPASSLGVRNGPVNELRLNSPNASRTSFALQPPKRSASPLPGNTAPISPLMDSRPEAVRRVSSTSPTSARPTSFISTPSSDIETASYNADLTADEESDPEDSETPWICSVWIKKTGHRQFLGTLTPALHHPKVIGQLKIPMRLEPIALAEVRGKAGSKGDKVMEKRVKDEVCITEENLKDVVCVTAMWLVAREEFGGLGRKKKA